MKLKSVVFMLGFAGICFGSGAWVFPLPPSAGIVVRPSKNSLMNINFLTQEWVQSNGAVTNNDHSAVNFAVRDARIAIEGQINSIIQFGAFMDFADNNQLGFDGTARDHQGTVQTSVIQDAYIGLSPSRSFNLTVGEFRDPFSRISLSGLYTLVIPSYYGYGIGPIDEFMQKNSQSTTNKPFPFINPFFPLGFGSIPNQKYGAGVTSAFRDIGVSVWGDVFKGMFKYYAFVGNGKYDYTMSQASPGNNYQTDQPNLKYAFRLVFIPTFLGFQSDPTYMMRDTYLGRLKTLQIGIGYETQKRECSGQPGSNCQTPTGSIIPASSVTSKAYDIDLFYETKYKNFVPQFQVGYVDNKDLGFGDKYGNKPSASGYYLQTQLMYDKYVGIGKPALALRYESYTNKNLYAVGTNGIVTNNPNNSVGAPNGSYQDGKIQNISVFLNYYIASQNAKISLGADFVNPNSVVKNAECEGGNPNLYPNTCGKNFVDYTLQLQVIF